MKKLILTTILMCLPLSLMAAEPYRTKYFAVYPKHSTYWNIRDLTDKGWTVIDVKLDEASDGYAVVTYTN